MNKIRLQKVIADAGICSRRSAEDLIRAEKVKVDKKIAFIGMSVDPQINHIEVSGKKIFAKDQKKIYFLLNKPKGIISTVSDESGRKSVIDLIKTNKRIVPVGRLDKDATGLLILTNDGDMVNKLTHPKFEQEKEYEVLVQIPHDWNVQYLEKAINKMRQGVEISNNFKTSKSLVKILNQISNDRYVLSIVIREGHKHQIRQMVDACGMSFVALKRVRISSIKLKNLKLGEYREMSKEEIFELKK